MSAKYLPLLLLATSAALSSCAVSPGPAGTKFVVTVQKAALYKYGPAQTFGPDFLLSKGQKVTMLKSDWGFCRVTTEDGTIGYIATDDIGPAPPEPPSAKPPAYSGRQRNSNVKPVPGSPLFDVSDSPTPLPEFGESPKPAPGFRY